MTFETFTLDFSEYLEMKKFHGLPIDQDLYAEFDEYVLNGGFPKTLELPDPEARQYYTRGVIGEIFEKDIKTRKRISNLAVFERVQSFLLNNYSAPFSISNLVDELKKEGLSTKATTVRSYIEDLKKAKIVYECNRFDLKSKKGIKRDQKYYLGDLAIYFSLNTDNRLSYGPSLENIVYLYLASQNYQVSIGKIGNFECDFIVRDKHQNYAYIQVTYTLRGEDAEATEKIKEREYRPFRNIRDGYPRYGVFEDRVGEVADDESVHAFVDQPPDTLGMGRVRQLDEADVPSDARLGIAEYAGEDVPPRRAVHPQRHGDAPFLILGCHVRIISEPSPVHKMNARKWYFVLLVFRHGFYMPDLFPWYNSLGFGGGMPSSRI